MQNVTMHLELSNIKEMNELIITARAAKRPANDQCNFW